MTLPASLLRAAEQHVCFSGCYGPEDMVMVSTAPGSVPQRVVQVSCKDCLSFHLGALASLLPAQMTSDQLARELSQHVRLLRGYAWSVGGYHYACNKIWLSAAFYPCGVFLLDGSRNHDGRSDLELLLEAFRGGLVKPQDARMLDPGQYATQEVYLDMSVPITPVRNRHDLLRSQQCSPTFRVASRRVTIAEFLPMQVGVPAPAVTAGGQPAFTAGAPPAGAGATGISATGTPAAGQPVVALGQPANQANQLTPPTGIPSSRPAAAGAAPGTPGKSTARLGERCTVCGAIVAERPSLTETFVGCLC
jgi:hypothetical protein